MPKFTIPLHRARSEAPLVPVEVCGTGSSLSALCYTGEGGAELAEWIRERRALRGALDHMGELDGWLQGKPTLTDLEYEVLNRRKEKKKALVLPQLLPDKGKEGLRDEEFLACLQTGRMDSKTHSYPSTLGGPTGRAVDSFRRQSLGEYLGSLELCQRHRLPISPSTLQKAFLHPGDTSEEFVQDKKESAPHKVYRERCRRQPLARRTDPNAFWPGHHDHVRSYYPVRSNRPESVLFHLIEHTSAPIPGHWPVNQAGYFTSGDINKHKTYTL